MLTSRAFGDTSRKTLAILQGRCENDILTREECENGAGKRKRDLRHKGPDIFEIEFYMAGRVCANEPGKMRE
eukprot:CAMPEP_0167812520 /NCGR_PEP_ID=MMETSP0112_2-20121227/1301_1 /TAXON_ID=91324 /ORGANISM="Lotharella globosa, Strain CCCM811" /LENGTH=71 /DNA_ID=CAMNT_0007711415 /DNA_START=622 /DNA_END=837 /DNA_ORIENTATION=+